MRELVEAARDAQAAAHAPYSEYRVGAAIRTADDTVFTGCNVENANYSNSLHAEEVALAGAVKRGHREFEAIAVSSGRRDGVAPCGMCRQTLAEFCEDDFRVVCDEGERGTDSGSATEGSTTEGSATEGSATEGSATEGSMTEYTLGELLPDAISAANLQ